MIEIPAAGIVRVTGRGLFGVLSGRFNLGIVPGYHQDRRFRYYLLYSEQMYLYCGNGHQFFSLDDGEIGKRDILKEKYAGIGFSSPNLEATRRLKLKRSAEVYDEEALAILILSGCYLGFLPDHYADNLANQGRMRRLCPDQFHYQSNHAAILRQTPRPSRLMLEFLDCLLQAHSLQPTVQHYRRRWKCKHPAGLTITHKFVAIRSRS